MSDNTEERFIASNGWHVNVHGVLRTGTRIPQLMGSCVGEAAQYFLEERDHKLRRWRDPEAPHMVCYCNDSSNVVRVVDERSGNADVLRRDEAPNAEDGFYGVVAARYFAAHPVKTIPTKPGLYVRKSEAADVAADLWQRSRPGDWSTDAGGIWRRCDESDLPDDLVRLVPEEAE